MSRSTVKRLAKKLNLEVTVEPMGPWGRGNEVCVQAPPGQHFAAVGVHEVVASDTFENTADRWAGVLDDIRGGFEPCTSETCNCWEDGHCGWWGEEVRR